ncbi:DL-endopeptidase inhibitor IseA family protein [Bacillus sp. DTU_2020_1000418_1_SI_GHA_SEK_038]|uniref:DL-endopeptidase inhibitor IseA family protein n=1 Tax=Bacillus sp. DTU_2020_1000418_1_SI_GHA_SEK_038 TaxID=3077585 RepID=UPI0028E41D6C|nr:DL-endopeptidase inhibitor IseA family protein [Bacillus sp. DTU_2020_1000418_1_SI_GHA_SEK_038]WNS73781.1 DL-endopeptidase inhibitor IseA family protein [Bacillus sp. DTU_2020_1000418_1_SI_GHA_SEK_038]
MRAKKWLYSGLAVTILSLPVFTLTDGVMAKEPPNKIVQNVKQEKKISEKQVVSLVSKWKKSETYVQSGGNYKEGEYKSFQYENMPYRYLSSDIGTKKKLLKYLTATLTRSQANLFIEERGIIEYKGKMAQPEADGGSLLHWDKAKAVFLEKDDKKRIYKLEVPVGETKETEVFHAEVIYLQGKGWKISERPYMPVNLDIPGNINPAFIFFKFLLVDHTQSAEQFLYGDFDTAAFKKGIKKIEMKKLEELARTKTQVEFVVSFHAELEKGYKGQLKNGENKMYFLIENTGEMEFKIVGAGMEQHLE